MTISMTKQLGHLSQKVISTLSMIIEALLSPLSNFKWGWKNQHIKSLSLFSLLKLVVLASSEYVFYSPIINQ